MNRHARTAQLAYEAETPLSRTVLGVNVALVILACSLLVSVVVLANQFAGLQVAVTEGQEDVRELRETQHRIGSVRAEREHPAEIEAFAAERGMVAADSVSYISVGDSEFAGR